VCSISRPDESWPTLGGDITATRLGEPMATHVVFSTSTSAVEGIPAAIAFGPDGALYVCDEGRRCVVRVDADGLTEFIGTYDGDPINGPNDLSFDPDGNLYFTDPWTSSPLNPVGAVYGFDWDERRLARVDSGMHFPNGIVVFGDRLFVAETFPRTVWVYDVVGPGRAIGKRQFCSLPDVPDAPRLPEQLQAALGVEYVVGPDGMCVDTDGRLYVTHYGGGGVYVYEPSGALSAGIETAGRQPTNVCFGGPDHRTLFITIDDLGSIVECEPGATGYRLPFCPSAMEDHPFARIIPLDATITNLPGRRALNDSSGPSIL
jgi:gluconolactonase